MISDDNQDPIPEKQKEVKSIWVYHQRETKSDETLFDSDGGSELPDSKSNLLDLEIHRKFYHDDAYFKYKALANMHEKLQLVRLDSISIPPSISQAQHIVNLRQSFTFPATFKPSIEIATQTSQMNLMPCVNPSVSQRSIKRPASLPPENIALTNLQTRVQADVKPKKLEGIIGDGIGNKCDKFNENFVNGLRKPDLELAECIPPIGVQCVIVKQKQSREKTPKFPCKKVLRPQTKYVKKRQLELLGNDSQSSSTWSNDVETKAKVEDKKVLKPKEVIVANRTLLSKKPENLLNFEMTSDLSTDEGLNVSGNCQAKLLTIVDKLHDQDWETNIEGLRGFQGIAGSMNWESELGQKFIPVISRKLIDFFKSPRSNLCRTACQTAGDFFTMAKSTKRPEFDEMIDILLSKSADPNRFIQKDANVALDKMAMNICVHHSVRAVCAKGPEHKNSVVRASTVRLLYAICKNAGIEQIVGADSNPRTRKRVLANLAKFLVDKNQETRRIAEKLCKLLKRHKFFLEYFFKDIENNQKHPLRKILNMLETK